MDSNPRVMDKNNWLPVAVPVTGPPQLQFVTIPVINESARRSFEVRQGGGDFLINTPTTRSVYRLSPHGIMQMGDFRLDQPFRTWSNNREWQIRVYLQILIVSSWTTTSTTGFETVQEYLQKNMVYHFAEKAGSSLWRHDLRWMAGRQTERRKVVNRSETNISCGWSL